jgi:transcription initiation factor TFIIA large subunit
VLSVTKTSNSSLVEAEAESDFDPDAEESDLGSEDDTIEDELPVSKNSIMCQHTQVSQKKHVWTMKMRHGIAHLNGRDYVFNRLSGNVHWV